MQRLVKRQHAVTVACLLDQAQLFQLGDDIADREIHLHVEMAAQLTLDGALQFGGGPAVRAALTPQDEVSEHDFAAFLLLGLIEQANEDAGVVVEVLIVQALGQGEAVALPRLLVAVKGAVTVADRAKSGSPDISRVQGERDEVIGDFRDVAQHVENGQAEASPEGQCDLAAIHVGHQHPGAGQEHVQVELGNLLEHFQIDALGIRALAQALVWPQFNEQRQPLEHRHRRFFEAVEVAEPAARPRLGHVAAGEDCQALEDAEIDVHVDAPVAGGAQVRFQVFTAEVAEVGPLHQPREVPVERIEAVRLRIGGHLAEGPSVGVRIEGRVSGLQLFQSLVILEMDRGCQLPAELPEGLRFFR